MNRSFLSAVALMFLGLMSFGACADDMSRPSAADVVSRFDLALEQGFPVHVATASDHGGRVRRSTDTGLVVTRHVRVQVYFPDGVNAETYVGTLAGKKAIFTRADDRLDITVVSADGVHVTGFSQGLEHIDRYDMPMIDLGDAPASLVARRARRSIADDHVEDPQAYSPTFRIYMHDDLVQRDVYRLHAIYTAWWLDDMADNVLPAELPLAVYYCKEIPGLTDVDYRQADPLAAWAGALAVMATGQGLAYGKTYKHKFLLLTEHLPAERKTGLAWHGQSEAIASVRGRASIVAHEFGHLLGAEHERAENRSQGLSSCHTNMSTSRSGADCFRYSDGNERAMRSYLRHGPVSDRLAPWLE